MAVLHHDSVSAHKAKKNVQWLEAHGCKFIPESDWPANLLDLSPMDFSINSISKRRLWKRHARDLTGLKAAMLEE